MKKLLHNSKIFKFGFTLAEVLITLVIVGVIAALTIPTLVAGYKKSVVESRLKKMYSTLANAVKMSIVSNGDIIGWDYNNQNFENFLSIYLLPYIQNAKITMINDYTCKVILADGTSWEIAKEGSPFWLVVRVDINGDAKPNKFGYDQFKFYIFNQAKSLYNAGNGNIAYNVPSQGVYYSGYGASKNELLNSAYRRCSNSDDGFDSRYEYARNSHCIALIIQNNWKIPSDYPLNLL